MDSKLRASGVSGSLVTALPRPGSGADRRRFTSVRLYTTPVNHNRNDNQIINCFTNPNKCFASETNLTISDFFVN